MNRVIKHSFIIIICLVTCIAFVFHNNNEVSYAASKKPSKVVITSVKSADYNAIKITWKKAKNAKKYQVYRATSKNGSYKLIKTTTARTYTNTKLTTGKKYYYKVRGVNGTKKGSYSSKKYAVPTLKQVVNVKATATENSIKLTWNKVNGAKGYQVYRAFSKNGTYKKLKTVTGRTLTNINLTVNKGYYYKVRAYRVVNGKYKYGKFSSIKYFKTLNHDFTKGKYVAPTCTEKGYQEYVCVCGEKTYTYVDATGHKIDKTTAGIVKEPTCSEDGINKGVCTVCGETSTFTVPKIGCTWEPIVETKYDGYYLYKPVTVAKECGICDEIVSLDGIEEHKNLHPGENPTFYPIVANQKSDEYVVTSEDVVVGWKCSTCGKVNGCSHSWYDIKDMYKYMSCNLCGIDLNNCYDTHKEYHDKENLTVAWREAHKEYLKCRLCGVEAIWDTNKAVVGEDHFVLE